MTKMGNEIEIHVGADVGPTRPFKENLGNTVIIPIMNSPIFPGMIAPIVLSEERFTPELEEFLLNSGYVALNLIKSKHFGRGKKENLISTIEEKVAAEDEEKVKKESKKKNSSNTHSNNENEVFAKDIYKVGVLCKIIKKLKLPDGSVNILVHGLWRYKATKIVSEKPFILAQPQIFEDILESDEELDAYTRSVINQVKKLSEINPYFNEEMKLAMLNSPSPGALADLVAFSLSLDIPEAQDFLETLVVKKRFAKLLVYLKREKDVADIQKKIADEVNDKVNKYQREYFLKEQLKIIRQELGMEEDERSKEIKKLRQDISDAKMPPDVEKIVLEELGKLEALSENGPEYHVTRTYLNLVVQLPWNKSSADVIHIPKAKQILEKDHYGLELAKERILEFLAVRKLKPQYEGSILCFVGPPGVGKTSLGKSIAKALNRKFYRIGLGGLRDEAEIKGHRRTYVGAMPGKLIQALKRVEVNNPVIMLDEIDKMGNSYQGDPASALLEVLDPEQNSKFFDNYLDVPFDLSKIFFIATANYLADIPEPLLDRMEVIELAGYTMEEKVSIALKWVLPKQLKKHGLSAKDLSLSKEVVKKIIADYAREPGVRVMEQAIARLCRKAAYLKVDKSRPKKLDPKSAELEKFLGVPKYRTEIPDKSLDPGVVVGLAWTAYGGEILLIESIPLAGKGFKITGQLGDVMNESASLAYSYVKKLLQKELKHEKSKKEKGVKREILAKRLDKIKDKNKDKVEKATSEVKVIHQDEEQEDQDRSEGNDYLANHEVHLHLPAGATPKDGPSAGITMALALYSLAHNQRIKAGVAMTGELSLTGKVLPIGGLKEKILAAKRAGIKEIIFPLQNVKDLKEVPERHRKGLKFYPVRHFDEVLKIAFKKRLS